MSINNIIIKNNNISFLTIKRLKKVLGYLWISPYFISKEGYRQIYKLSDEKNYNIKIQLKEITNIFPINGNIIITYSEWKNNYPFINKIKLKNYIINNNEDFINIFNKYSENEEIKIINIKILLVEDGPVENL